MIQDGIGVYIPNSKDSVCHNEETPVDLPPDMNRENEHELESYKNVLSTSTELIITTQQNLIPLPTIRPPVIRPISIKIQKVTRISN